MVWEVQLEQAGCGGRAWLSGTSWEAGRGRRRQLPSVSHSTTCEHKPGQLSSRETEEAAPEPASHPVVMGAAVGLAQALWSGRRGDGGLPQRQAGDAFGLFWASPV